jgi:hypothetical protein
MTRSSTYFIALLTTACAGVGPIEPRSAPVAAASSAAASPSGQSGAGSVELPFELVVHRADGVEPQTVRVLLAPSLGTLHQCAPGSGGKINLEVTAVDGRIHVAIAPGDSLDPTLRECVLQALSRIDDEQTGGDVPGATVRPTGFTSLVAVSW